METPSQQGPKRKRRRIQFVNYLDDHKAHAKQLRKRRHKKFKPYKVLHGRRRGLINFHPLQIAEYFILFVIVF